MATTGLRKVLEQLHRALPAPGGQPDGDLLTHFIATRDEAAFAALVRRHGPMVLGVCRRLLRNDHDAEDAFQATFLVLARRAGSVLNRESVGSWLYGVACRTARQAAAANARRRARERQVENMPHPEVAPAEAQDWLALLDQELSRLPEKYRAAVVLCDLGGCPRREGPGSSACRRAPCRAGWPPPARCSPGGWRAVAWRRPARRWRPGWPAARCRRPWCGRPRGPRRWLRPDKSRRPQRPPSS
jgi:RNA polymerase sigma factor (sigma-70 family)